jgi:hypothetical protein
MDSDSWILAEKAPDRPTSCKVDVATKKPSPFASIKPGTPIRALLLTLVTFGAILVPGSRAHSQSQRACRNVDPSLKPGLTATIDLKTDITRATTDKNSFGASLKLNDFRHPQACGPKRQQTSVSLDGKYEDKKPKGKALTITRNYETTLQHQIYLPGNRFYVAGNARLLHNTDLGVYLSQRYSALLGTMFGNESASWELFAGPAFVGQHFLASASSGARTPSRSYAAAYVGELGTIRLAKLDSLREVTLNHAFWATIPTSGENPYALNEKWLASIVLPLTTRVAVTARVFDEYLRNAPPGFERDYLNAGIGVTVKIGRM